jgi:molybdate transport system permease protein
MGVRHAMTHHSLRERPAFLLIPGVIALVFLIAPLLALAGNAPWSAFGDILSSPTAREALRITFVTSIAATALALLIGTPLAFLLAREALPATRLWRALVIVPLLLPPVVSGVALLAAFGRRGFVGGFLYDTFGFQFPFTTWGVVLAGTFVAMPFLIITLEGAFRSLEREVEEAASVDGAGPWMIFSRITLPLIAPSLLAGTVLCWARAIGEFGATITFAGNLQGTTQTMPLAVYTALESDRETAVALSIVLLVVAVAILVALRGSYLPRRTAERTN